MTQANVLAQIGATSGPTFRNRIINGAMVIDQRNAGASVTPTSGQYLVDRFYVNLTQASKFTAQQNAGSVTPPVGFTNYQGITSSSAYSITSGDVFVLAQAIEGYNTADLGWGTADAKTVTVSFWVRSSLTGTFGGCVVNSAGNRSYPFSYTITSANTWEYETITIAGDTTGTWVGATNGVGLNLFFGLGVGSTYTATAGAWAAGNYRSSTGATSVVGTNGATFYITGVQLEAGSSATGFEYENYTSLLTKCQRYYAKSFANGTTPLNGSTSTSFSTYIGIFASPFIRPNTNPPTANDSTTSPVSFGAPIVFPVTMRTAASITIYGNNAGAWFGQGTGVPAGSWAGVSVWNPSDKCFTAGTSFITPDSAGAVYGHWTASAEL